MSYRVSLPLAGSILAVSLSALNITPVQAQSLPECTSASSDPDGDGWGWENNASCLVVDTTQPAPDPGPVTPPTDHPSCLAVDSDPDGDGWGWENGQSCIVSTAPTPEPEPEPEPDVDGGPNAGVIPGQSLLTASEISLDGPVSATLEAGAIAAHWYRFTVDHDRPISIAIDGTSSGFGLELNAQFANGVSVTSFSFSDFFSDEYNVICIPPDDYYLKIDSYHTADTDIEYSFEVATTPFRCELEDFTLSGVGEFFESVPGGYLLMEDSKTLTSYSHDGVLRWKHQFDHYVSYDRTVVTEDTIYIATDETLNALDLEGSLLWQYSVGAYLDITALLITGDTVYLGANGTLFALNLNGTPKWVDNVQLRQPITRIAQGDNGSVYVMHGYGSLSVYNIP